MALPSLKDTEAKTKKQTAWAGLRTKQNTNSGSPAPVPTSIPTSVMETPQSGVVIPEPDLSADSSLIQASAAGLTSALQTQKAEQAKGISAAEKRVRELQAEQTGTDYVKAVKDSRTRAGVDDAQSELDTLLETIATQTEANDIFKAQNERTVKDLAGRGQGVPAQIVRGQQQRLRNQQIEEEQIKDARLGKLLALAQLKQGNVEQATQLAAQAFGLENKAKEAALATEKDFLHRNYDQFDATQRELADARLKAIDEESKLEDTKMELKVSLFSVGAPDSVQQAIANAKTKKELYAIPGIANYVAQAEAAKAAAKSGGGIKLTNDKRLKLIGAGFTEDEVGTIEAEVAAYGIDAVLEGIDNEKQRQALLSVYGGEEDGFELTREAVSKFYGLPDDGSGKVLGMFGKTTSQKLDDIMGTIERYRAVGVTDEQILDKIQKK